jgi:cell division protein FtsI (penicillin-binding protein 3)
VNPQHFVRDDKKVILAEEKEKFKAIAKLLTVPSKKVKWILSDEITRQYVSLKRRVLPELASKVRAIGMRGIGYEREFKRYYPTGTIAAHVVGFTNIDDVGLEGLERGYEHILKGMVGKKRVIKDGDQNVISDVKNI